MSGAPLALTVTPLPCLELEADVVVVPVFDGDRFEDVNVVNEASAGDLQRAFDARELSPKPFDAYWTSVPTRAWRVPRLLAIGAGPADRWTAETARRVATTGTLLARQRRLTRIAFCVRAARGTTAAAVLPRLVQAVSEGVTLGLHTLGHMKSQAPDTVPITSAWLLTPAGSEPASIVLSAAAQRGRVLAESTNLARALGNEPGNVLTPRELARRAEEAARGTTLSVDVLDEARLHDLGMGLLLGVARGSAEPPRVLVLRHDPPDAPKSPVLGLVGKGVTFDTGGISIKPADGMDRMKVDMAGAAAVIGALRAAALLEAPTRVIGVIPSTENMPGSTAVKPGDVLRGASGKTVEVVNTDAEGRLILADALWYAQTLGATHLVDVATLTGACVVALGRVMSGLFGTHAVLNETIRALGDLTGDRCWPMPAVDDYFESLKSDVADMTNTGGRPGGAVTAALFLKQFTNGMPWAHLDIAGTAWSDDARPYQIKGATGSATRLLAELALDPGRWA